MIDFESGARPVSERADLATEGFIALKRRFATKNIAVLQGYLRFGYATHHPTGSVVSRYRPLSSGAYRRDVKTCTHSDSTVVAACVATLCSRRASLAV